MPLFSIKIFLTSIHCPLFHPIWNRLRPTKGKDANKSTQYHYCSYFHSCCTVLSNWLPAQHDPVIMLYTNNRCCLLLSAAQGKFHLSPGLYLGSSKNERSLFLHAASVFLFFFSSTVNANHCSTNETVRTGGDYQFVSLTLPKQESATQGSFTVPEL